MVSGYSKKRNYGYKDDSCIFLVYRISDLAFIFTAEKEAKD